MLDPFLNISSASSWLPPAGYSTSFIGQFGAVSTTNYMGFFQLSSYNTSQCAAYCSAASGCQGFNIYHERAPVYDPSVPCADSTAQVSINCALWGSPVYAANATNYGQMRNAFYVVITGSNGYNVNSNPSQVANYKSPVPVLGSVPFDGAGFLNSTYWTTPFDNSKCAAACTNYSYAQRLAASKARTSSYIPCNYFNTFNLTYQGTYQGQYCVLYSSSSISTQASITYSTSITNNITYVYNITNSWGNALSPQDNGVLGMANYIPNDPPGSCLSVSPKSSNNTFSSSSGVIYTTACGYDLSALGDLGTVSSKTWMGCADICDARSGCSAFNFGLRGVCYLKNITGITTPPNGDPNGDFAYIASKASWPGAGALPAVIPNTCRDLRLLSGGTTSYLDTTNNLQYNLQCNADLIGAGDYSTIRATAFTQCLSYCSANSTCNAFSFSLASSTCVLKNAISFTGLPTSALGINIGIIPSRNPGIGGTWKYSPSGNSASCSSLSLSNSTYTDSNGVTYNLACGFDLTNVGDLAVAYVENYYGCFAACDAQTGCTGFSYRSGTCFLKSLSGVLKKPTVNAGVDFAWIPSLWTPSAS